MTNTLGATYYVPNTGVFLRGGLGYGFGYDGNTQAGFAGIAAAGYEWALRNRLGLASRIEYTYQSLGPGAIGENTPVIIPPGYVSVAAGQSVNMFGVGVDFNWYF